MSKLTIHLIKILNLCDSRDHLGLVKDVADPYVQFSLKQTRGGPFRKDHEMGTQRSTVVPNDRNPVYHNETFTFEDLPSSLKNLELTIRVMDKDETSRKDDKLGSTTVHLAKLKPSLEPILQTYRFKINNRLVRKDSYIFIKLSYGESVVDEDVQDGTLSHVGQAAYDCLRTFYGEYHHSLWNVTKGRMVGELHQTPKTAFHRGLDKKTPHPDGSNDWFPQIMGDILSRATKWADVLSLGPPDGRFMTAFQQALVTINENAAGQSEPVVIRMMFGYVPRRTNHNCRNGRADHATPKFLFFDTRTHTLYLPYRVEHKTATLSACPSIVTPSVANSSRTCLRMLTFVSGSVPGEEVYHGITPKSLPLMESICIPEGITCGMDIISPMIPSMI
jgi:hypothetical protein